MFLGIYVLRFYKCFYTLLSSKLLFCIYKLNKVGSVAFKYFSFAFFLP